MTESAAISAIKQAIMDRGWEHNKAGKLAVLYLIGKGKSLKMGQWLSKGIAALPQPLLSKRQLRITARANTTFLRLLTTEIPCSVLATDVNQVSKWYHWLSPQKTVSTVTTNSTMWIPQISMPTSPPPATSWHIAADGA